MKISKFFLSTLIAAAAMTSSAYADYEWKGGTTITQDLWASQDSWSLTGTSVWKDSGTGPLTTNSNMWDKAVIANASGTITSLEGWNLKLDLTKTLLTVDTLVKFQAGNTVNVALDKDSVLTINKYGGSAVNQGSGILIDNAGIVNIGYTSSNNNSVIDLSLGTTGVVNITSQNGGSHKAKIKSLSATINLADCDTVDLVSRDSWVGLRELITLGNNMSLALEDTSGVQADGGVSDLKLFTSESGVYAEFSAVASAALGVLVWDGAVDSTWNMTDSNWRTVNGGSGNVFEEGDYVAFDTSATTSIKVDAAGVTAEQVAIWSGNVSFSGGKVTASDKFVVSKGATLTLTANNNISGDVKVYGTFDLNGKVSGLTHNGLGKIILSGGTLKNSAADVWASERQITNLELAADSTILADKTFGLVGNQHGATTLGLGNGNTLKKEGNGTFFLVNTTISGVGTIDIAGGEISTGGSNVAEGNRTINVVGNLTLTGPGQMTTTNFNVTSGGIANITGSGQISIGGKLYSSAGAIAIGSGEVNTVVSANRLELGDFQSGTSTLTINDSATLKVTGDVNNWIETETFKPYKNNSVVLGEWGISTTATISGTLLAKDAEVGMGDSGATITLSGTLAAKGIGQGTSGKAGDGAFSLTLNDRGKLILGSSGMASTKTDGTVTLNAGTIASYADTSFNRAMILNSENGTTFDTQNYTFTNDGNSIVRDEEDTVGNTITVAGVLSGAGKLIVTGGGTLVLYGDSDKATGNCYTRGTVIDGATLKVKYTGWGANSVGNDWNRGDIGGDTTQDKLQIKNEGVLEVVEVQDSTNNKGYGKGGVFRGFSVTSKKGTYRYSGKADSSILADMTLQDDGTYGKPNSHIGIAHSNTNNGTKQALAFDVVEDVTLTVSKVIAATTTSGEDTTDGALIKEGVGTLLLSGANLYSGGTTISKGTLVAAHASALGTGAVSVESDAVLTFATTVNAGTVTLAEGAKFALDLSGFSSGVSDEDSIALNILSATALTFNGTDADLLSSEVIDGYFDAENSNLGDYTTYLREWSYANKTLTLTLAIPEPSMFGLLAGLGALALVGTRRRRK